MAPRTLLLNGKFLSAAPTGVHRVAAELSSALAQLIAEGNPAVQDYRLSALVPHDGLERAAQLPVGSQLLGPLRGIPWEQITLPLRRPGGTLLNLCNIGPVLSRDAVTMIHDVQVLLTPESYSWAFRRWYRTIQPALARRHRHLLTVSNYSRERIVAAGLCRPERISVVHNGSDHVLREVSDPVDLDLLGLRGQRYVLALASTQAYKNIAVLLRAFAAADLQGTRLVLFGGAARQDFERLGHPVPGNVVFAGRISDASLRCLYEHALCLAFPSITEGFGLPPLEAMQLGCPVIAAPCGALPEVCGEGANYASPHDARVWAEAIGQLLGSEAERNALASRGLSQAANFTWRRAALTLAGVLSQI